MIEAIYSPFYAFIKVGHVKRDKTWSDKIKIIKQ